MTLILILALPPLLGPTSPTNQMIVRVSELYIPLNFQVPDVWHSTRPILQDGYRYDVHMRATDLAGNVEPIGDTNTFTYDVSSPTTRVNLPVHLSNNSSLPTISGTVGDNTGLGGVSVVELAIRVDTGTWYSNVS